MKFDPQNLDRRYIYLFVLCALMLPLVMGLNVRPVKLKPAQTTFEIVDSLTPPPGDIAFLAFDFGPSTQAENLAQAEVVMEHLMRRRIPIALFSLTFLAEPFLRTVPEKIAERLRADMPGEDWLYGEDWVNIGYKPGSSILLQAIPKSKDIAALFKEDVR